MSPSGVCEITFQHRHPRCRQVSRSDRFHLPHRVRRACPRRTRQELSRKRCRYRPHISTPADFDLLSLTHKRWAVNRSCSRPVRAPLPLWVIHVGLTMSVSLPLSPRSRPKNWHRGRLKRANRQHALKKPFGGCEPVHIGASRGRSILHM